MAGWSQGNIAEQRAKQEKKTKFARLPTGIQCQSLNVDGVSAEWITVPDTDQGVILYLHGGAYALGSINVHRQFIARLAIATNIRCLGLNYRLAPEHPFPAALEDTLTAYHWLLSQGLHPSQIIIAGDSAGGGLALAAMLSLRNSAAQLPAGAVCLSPWTDLALTGPSIQGNAKVDPILDLDSLHIYAKYYAAQNEITNPLISPLYADLHGLPPLLIQVGGNEILLDDAVRLHKNALNDGVNATLKIWHHMFHVFQMISFLPETKEALQSITEFVIDNLKTHNNPLPVADKIISFPQSE